MANLITKHIPNTLTSCNLISGCIATVFALNANYGMALAFIIIGAVFDFFGGMSARLLGVSSPIGKELDSLADDVTFGVAPSSMIFTLLLTIDKPDALAPVARYVPYLAFIMAAFSALRLAKFNLDERQTTSFIGLPTPANALFWGALIVGSEEWLTSTGHHLPPADYDICQQLATCCRDTDVCAEVQALGMARQQDQVRLHRFLSAHIAYIRHLGHLAHNSMVYHPVNNNDEEKCLKVYCS